MRTREIDGSALVVLVWSGEINDKFLWKLLSYEDAEPCMTLCSEGGDVDVMLAAIDHMKGVYSVCCTGRIYSAAVPIVAICKSRVATKNTRFMLHEAFTGTDEMTGRELKKAKTELDRAERIAYGIMGEYSRQTAKWWRDKCRDGDFYFGAKEAKRYGLIDRIV